MELTSATLQTQNLHRSTELQSEIAQRYPLPDLIAHVRPLCTSFLYLAKNRSVQGRKTVQRSLVRPVELETRVVYDRCIWQGAVQTC